MKNLKIEVIRNVGEQIALFLELEKKFEIERSYKVESISHDDGNGSSTIVLSSRSELEEIKGQDIFLLGYYSSKINEVNNKEFKKFSEKASPFHEFY